MRFLIWSFDHNQWWRPNGRGYTCNQSEAGRYTLEDLKKQNLDAFEVGDIPRGDVLIAIKEV